MANLELVDSGPAAARPLGVLVKLIREDAEAARQAADTAAQPFYAEIGRKLLEAKGQMAHREFIPWVERHFTFRKRQAQLYMQLAHATVDLQKRIHDASTPETFRDAVRKHTDNVNYGKKADWRAALETNVKNARADAERLKEEALTRQQERDAEKKLALQLIDIGFKALAAKLHPDKGGSRDAMSRLNRVRARLKNHA